MFRVGMYTHSAEKLCVRQYRQGIVSEIRKTK
jgi:hypothetical protein